MFQEVRRGRWYLRQWASKSVSRGRAVCWASACLGCGALGVMILTWACK